MISEYFESIKTTTSLFDTVTGAVGLPKELVDDSQMYFAVKADRDGMTAFGIDNGDTMVFEVTDRVSSGEIGAFVYGPEHQTACRLFKQYENGSSYLLGNPEIREPISVDLNDPDFHIAGKLTAIIKDVRNKKY